MLGNLGSDRADASKNEKGYRAVFAVPPRGLTTVARGPKIFCPTRGDRLAEHLEIRQNEGDGGKTLDSQSVKKVCCIGSGEWYTGNVMRGL